MEINVEGVKERVLHGFLENIQSVKQDVGTSRSREILVEPCVVKFGKLGPEIVRDIGGDVSDRIICRLPGIVELGRVYGKVLIHCAGEVVGNFFASCFHKANRIIS